MSFKTHGKFYADAQFPYGLRRSGLFTVAQADLLENHGQAYQALHQGIRHPDTEEEKAFLAVCRGEQAPATPHERAWMRFCEVTSLKLSRARISAFGKCDDQDFVLNDAHILDSDAGSRNKRLTDGLLGEDGIEAADTAFLAARGDDGLEQYSY